MLEASYKEASYFYDFRNLVARRFLTQSLTSPTLLYSSLDGDAVDRTSDQALSAGYRHSFSDGESVLSRFHGEVPVAYGWVATQEGSLAAFQLSFAIPSGNCYLYGFLTFPEWRGRGIYPHLLQAIIHQEQLVDRFWIGYLPDNEASGRGVSKAGFHVVSDLVLADGHVSGMTLFESSERAQASADFFHLPVVTGT